MPKATLRNQENFEDLYKRFKRIVNKAEVLKESRRREEYLPKSLQRKLKAEESRRKNKF
ncbi:MAG: 30S ribosomal protein S21 [Bacilli bacterium]|nr:30S ribosomal protein S21 [Bacilli bacterium]